MLDLAPYSVGVRMLALSTFGRVTPRLFDHLLASFGSLDEIYFADSEDLAKVEGLTKEQRRLIEECSQHLDQARQLETVLATQGIKVICRYDDGYRVTLTELNDPPMIYFQRGTLEFTARPTLALVGSAIGSQSGMALAAECVRQLSAHHISLTTSLRGGIDASVILAATTKEIPLTAVTDTAIDKPLSEDLHLLYKELIAGGLLVTEHLKRENSSASEYEESNRLIAGLSDAVAVIECHHDDKEVIDMMAYCEQIGKLCFFLTDPKSPELIDHDIRRVGEKSGVIPIEFPSRLDVLLKVLV